jgi:hypothetical protein
MNRRLLSSATAATLSAVGLMAQAGPAAAYPVDCAILLCLAGGWPVSAPCAEARAVFIARITPWPIEPPLQIWNCPMGVSLPHTEPDADLPRLWQAFIRSQPDHSSPLLSQPPAAILVEATPGADIDVSAPAFDFVRTIRVFDIQYWQDDERDGSCDRSDRSRIGTYGSQGEFAWSSARVSDVPGASNLNIPGGCTDYHYRSVFVEWRDHAGNYDFGEVRY